MRTSVTLKCKECGEETYRVSKNKRNTPDRLSLSKYCPKCRTTRNFVEKKK